MIQCEHLHAKDLWDYNDNQLYNKRAEKCLTVKQVDGKSTAILEACTGAPNQQWEFDPHKEDENEVWNKLYGRETLILKSVVNFFGWKVQTRKTITFIFAVVTSLMQIL